MTQTTTETTEPDPLREEVTVDHNALQTLLDMHNELGVMFPGEARPTVTKYGDANGKLGVNYMKMPREDFDKIDVEEKQITPSSGDPFWTKTLDIVTKGSLQVEFKWFCMEEGS